MSSLRADQSTEKAILAALDQLNTAFAKRDLEAALAVFAPDPDTLLLGSERGEAARGPAELRRLLAHFFDEPTAYRWTWHEREVFRVGDVAWVVADATIHEVTEAEERSARYRIVGVFERADGKWAWALFAGSVPDEPTQDWATIMAR